MNDSNFRMITVTNSGYKRITENCIISLMKIKFPLEKIIIYAMDIECQEYLKKKFPTITVKLNDYINKEEQQYLQKDWNTVTMQKINIISKELDNYEYLILFDGDIVFNKLNFADFLLDKMNKDKTLELFTQEEFKGNASSEICSGFYILRSTDNTKKYFNSKYFLKNNNYYCNDQYYVNSIKHNLKWEYLPLNLFPNGSYFYDHHKNRDEAYIIHFNFIKFQQKESRMRTYNKWFL